MRKADALAHYQGNAAALGRAIGVTRSTVMNWPEIIPFEPARAIEIVTFGRVPVKEQDYPRLAAAHQSAKRIKRELQQQLRHASAA